MVEPVVEAIARPLAETEAPPAVAAMEPEPLAAAEAPTTTLPEVTYGSSGVVEVVPPPDVPATPPDVPGFKKRKRGKRRKGGPNAPAPDLPPR